VCWQDTRERIEAHQLGGLTIVAVCRPRAKAHKSERAQRRVGMMEPPQACSKVRRGAPYKESSLSLLGVDVHHLLQQLHRLLMRALEGIPAHDGPEGSTLGEAADLV
jgi:hypothetical protein